ncbi:MAG: Exonuclease RNase and polymerase [Thermomicrobiales bacterium]|nr:Exonuclease RNase and polymerase [Thermomicrobiales bacterium]
MRGNQRGLRRAATWRWEPPGAETFVADARAQERWDAARAKAITWAVAAAQDPRVVYLDTETTGFGKRAEIVDIAVVDGGGQVLFESLVRPTRRIPAEVIAIHGITNADVKDAPEWGDLYDELGEVLAGRRIVVYNVTFDKQMVTQACEQYALTAPEADWECAMKRYAGFHGSWDPGKRWYRFQKLERAVLTFGAEPGGHRAAADALACRAVVLGMAATAPPSLDAPADESPIDTSRSWHVPSAASNGPGSRAGEAGNDEPEALRCWRRAASAFMDLVDSIPVELRERPGACGEWSVRDVVAHCAGWEWEGARRLRLLTADPARPDAVYDVDRFNGASVAVRAKQDWARTLDELAKASASLGTAAADLPDDPRTDEWLRGRATDFDTHGQELRDWLAANRAPAHERRTDTTP